MSNSLYTATSPYFDTSMINDQYLDITVNRTIPKLSTDVYWKITPVYHHRPDMLAYDLYGKATLWWVFANRNPNELLDPLFDFVAGREIFLPTIDTLVEALGI